MCFTGAGLRAAATTKLLATMSKKKNKGSGYVYSTDPDFTPPDLDDETEATPPPEAQDLRVTLNKRLKGGKVATVVYDFEGAEDDLKALGKQLKGVCGVGGSVKDGEIILQGNCLDKVGAELTRRGYKFKFAGI